MKILDQMKYKIGRGLLIALLCIVATSKNVTGQYSVNTSGDTSNGNFFASDGNAYSLNFNTFSSSSGQNLNFNCKTLLDTSSQL